MYGADGCISDVRRCITSSHEIHELPSREHLIMEDSVNGTEYAASYESRLEWLGRDPKNLSETM